ncbi:hypothetical protein Pcinc_013034 [Petrolisthes cinctipes]|uniref:Uncharacterized protein n=1 Tax=Petrolisthes cinctipes TaxID=88211 RepID=A0AAE1G3G8_PETCI|nr:hypothetical protein Pcinc_013034 [Petrolisthes cinctipes]
MAVIVGLLVILATSLVVSPQDTDGASININPHSPPPTQYPYINNSINPLTELQTNSSLQSNVSNTNSYSTNLFQPSTPIQQSNTSDSPTVAVTTTDSKKITTTTGVSLPDTTTDIQPSQTSTLTTVSPNITTPSTPVNPSSTTPHTSTTSTTTVTTSPSKTTSDLNTTTTTTTTTIIPPSSIPPSSLSPTTSPTTTPTTSVPLTSPTTTPTAPHHTGASIAITLFILVTVILLIGAGVWWMRRRRQLERLRHQLMPMYNFDPAEDLDDWENQLLEEERSLRPEADKVQLYSGNATFEAAQKATQNDIGPKD